MRIENPFLALYRGTEYFSLARTFRTVWGGEMQKGSAKTLANPLTGAEAAGFEPANRFRAVNCFRGSLLQPLGHASCLIPPNPLFKGAIRACGLSIATGPSLLASSGPASDDALLLYWDSVPNPDTPCGLYVLHVFASQIPGPGRSSDDDLLNSPDPLSKGAIRPSCAPELGGHRFAVLRPASDDACPNSPDPLFKGAIRACGLSIAAMAFPARQLRPGI